MEVIAAKSAGFCFGVARAVHMAEQLAGTEHPKMLGHIIHNDHEIARLESLGLTVIQSPEQAQAGDRVLLRAHGEAKAVCEALKRRGAEIVDATCPRVARVQQIVAEAEKEGRQPVMIGDPGHPEVRGVAGWCRNLQVFSGPEEVAAWAETLANTRDLPVSVVSQTTLRREIWESSLNFLKKQCT
ncbi:MAG: bifunctional 4-hydroxy-3-methylbut-2-enyl diphosphate reductase/30S ribosomal protein S1, partial [Oscillospiraceae bacterium]|nr:bifunctional 4-hydroxy-3-methylbut-2-enyl diphosphate reductase/30S ribosomal protein S1 [Oscillospiraceae bacterium]